MLNRLPRQSAYWPSAHGYYGVDLFFVISGLIIRYTVHRREQGPALFLRRRAERIIPLYWLTTLGFFGLSLLHTSGHTPVSGAVTSLLRSLAFLGWTAGPGATPTAYVGWSLEYEMFFYLVMAGWLAVTRRPSLPIIASLAIPIVLGRFAGAEAGNAALFFICNPILIEFLIGILIADVMNGERPYVAGAIVLAALATIPAHGWGERIWVAGVPSALLVAVAAFVDRRGTALDPITRFFAKLGDASYSIYLVQVFTITILCKIVTHLVPHIPLLAAIVLITALTVAASYVVFLLVERPLQRMAHRLDTDRAVRRAKASPVMDPTPTGLEQPATSNAS